MNRIQPLGAHVAYMTCPGNHGLLIKLFVIIYLVTLQKYHTISVTILTGSQCLLMTIHSGIHGIWAQYISSGHYNH